MNSNILVILTIISMLVLLFGVIFSIIIGRSDNKNESEEIKPTQAPIKKEFWEIYDHYIISILWPPSSCFLAPSNNGKSCFIRIKNESFEQKNTIHGLWPQSYNFIDKDFFCNNPNNSVGINLNTELKNSLKTVWPGFFSNDKRLWNYEYNKHGYCYIQRMNKSPRKDYLDFFMKTKEIYDKYNFKDFIKTVLPDFAPGNATISKKKLRESINYSQYKNFIDSYVLICNNNNFFDQIYFSLDLDFNPAKKGLDNETCGDSFVIPFKDENEKDVSQKIDYYVFAIFWFPGECKGKSKDCYKEIKKDKTRIQYATIHGLWPSFKSGIHPRSCNFGEDLTIENFDSDLQSRMTNFWYAAYNGNNHLWSHEYNKHGFCYNKISGKDTNNYKVYFEKGLELYESNNFKDIFINLVELYPGDNKFKKSELKNLLESRYPKDSFVFNCNKKNNSYLTEIWFKMDMGFNLTNEGILNDKCGDDIIVDLIQVEGPQTQDNEIKDKYDCYVFSISWPATFCMMKGKKCFEKLKDIPQNIFNIHGLWPSYQTGNIPEWCNGKNDIEIEIKDNNLLEDMKKYWACTFRTCDYYYGHEYNKHGYCYNKRNNFGDYEYEKYFKKTIDLFKQNNLMNVLKILFKDDLSAGIKIIEKNKLYDVLNELGFRMNTYKLSCYLNKDSGEENDYYLSEILLLLDLEFKPLELKEKNDDCPNTFKVKFLD